MRFYNQQHRFYCGVDLHAKTLAVHILDAEGQTVLAAMRSAGFSEQCNPSVQANGCLLSVTSLAADACPDNLRASGATRHGCWSLLILIACRPLEVVTAQQEGNKNALGQSHCGLSPVYEAES